MPVPAQRDPETTRRLLEQWLARRLPGARVPRVQTPQTSGFSSETLMFEVERDGRLEALVARVAPSAYQIFPEPRFGDEHRLMRVLDERTDIPVPAVRWYEPSDEPLGAPFFVMARVDGRVPPDMPPYHSAGWVTEVPPGERAAMWWSALDILARVHRLDVDALGLGFLDRPRWGPTGLRQRLGYYAHYLDWAYPGPQDIARRALDWLTANAPDEPDPPVLLWGDARIGNVIFQDGVPRAVLDWECAVLGAPEEDLAWFLYLDRHHAECVEVPRLAGFPSHERTVRRYAGLIGRPPRHLRYYEVLSGFKFAVIMARIGQAMIDFGWIPPDDPFPRDNTATRLLGRILEENA
ncbi:phosphotransferase family protein [Thermomonospora cellulosilytica]|uniref:Aminoglycoside phosphotransferase (APT) family kinase protein n=1 Tax=Thermomonospora cellulosilytica TaxID=1411118 RepID=A0A7W3RD02_9ACTN|nr:phosphotransferase family protein [Thermomonospora cellulosilytica]MBA9007815.1 aminoglycoside phosphotransferase (APT) family kinase protein [Thermomonospora cellulosilytica]